VKLTGGLWNGLHEKDGDQGKSFGNWDVRELFMPCRPRYCLGGLPVHVLQRGNNREVCFAKEADMAAYANW
jgi:hypothetical protein